MRMNLRMKLKTVRRGENIDPAYSQPLSRSFSHTGRFLAYTKFYGSTRLDLVVVRACHRAFNLLLMTRRRALSTECLLALNRGNDMRANQIAWFGPCYLPRYCCSAVGDWDVDD